MTTFSAGDSYGTPFTEPMCENNAGINYYGLVNDPFYAGNGNNMLLDHAEYNMSLDYLDYSDNDYYMGVEEEDYLWSTEAHDFRDNGRDTISRANDIEITRFRLLPPKVQFSLTPPSPGPFNPYPT